MLPLAAFVSKMAPQMGHFGTIAQGLLGHVGAPGAQAPGLLSGFHGGGLFGFLQQHVGAEGQTGPRMRPPGQAPWMNLPNLGIHTTPSGPAAPQPIGPGQMPRFALPPSFQPPTQPTPTPYPPRYF